MAGTNQKDYVITTLTRKSLEREVKKANTLIQACYRLTRQEMRCLLVMISQVQDADPWDKVYRVETKSLIDTLGLGKKNGYRQLKAITKQIMSRVVEYINAEGDFIQAHWTNKFVYPKNREGYVDFQFHQDMAPFLFDLKEKFTAYHLKKVMEFKSIYSFRFYELLQFFNGWKEQFVFKIDELKARFQIPKTKYKQFSHFKSKVVQVAKDELDIKADLSFTFNEMKEKRKVTGFVFTIVETGNKRKLPKKTLTHDQQTILNTVIELIPETERKDSHQIASKILEKNGPEGLKWYIAYVNEKKPKKNYGGYMRRVWEKELWEKELSKQESLKGAEEARIAAEQAYHKKIDKQNADAKKWQGNCDRLIASLTPEAKTLFESEVMKSLPRWKRNKSGPALMAQRMAIEKFIARYSKPLSDEEAEQKLESLSPNEYQKLYNKTASRIPEDLRNEGVIRLAMIDNIKKDHNKKNQG